MFAPIRAAEDHINMETYILDDDEIGRRFSEVLIERQAQGVQVNLIYDSLERRRAARRRRQDHPAQPTDSGLVFHAGRSYYDDLLSNGVKIYERREALLHAKTAVIDGIWSTIGSTNLDWRSFLHNDELNAVVLGSEIGAQMEAMFGHDLAESDTITLEECGRRSLLARIKERVSRMWAYWL